MNKKAFALTTLIMLLIIAFVIGAVMTKWVFIASLAVFSCLLIMQLWYSIYEAIEREIRLRDWRKK